MATIRAMKPTIRKRVIGLLGFIEFIGLFGFVGFVGFIGFIELLGFVGLNFKGTKEKISRKVRIPYRGMWRRL
jgi:hypothetical protein